MTTEGRRIPMGIGAEDSRPQMEAIEGRRIDVLDPRLFLPVPPSLGELTQESIAKARRDWDDQGKVDRIQRAIEVLDYIDFNNLSDRRRVFALFLWDELDSSVGVNKFLGVSRKTSLDAYIGEAMDDSELIKKTGYVQFLVRPNHFEALKMKKEGISHKEISEMTETPEGDIEVMSRRFILAGLYHPHASYRRAPDEYRKFCDQVARLRDEGLANYEIASSLGTPGAKVHRAVTDLIAIGEITPIDPADAKMKKSRYAGEKELKASVKDLRSRGFQVSEIAQQLGVSFRKVESMLYRTPEMPRVRQTREEQKRILARILDQFLKDHPNLAPGEFINLTAIRLGGELKIDSRTMNSLYDELALTRVVPPRKVLKRKNE